MFWQGPIPWKQQKQKLSSHGRSIKRYRDWSSRQITHVSSSKACVMLIGRWRQVHLQSPLSSVSSGLIFSSFAQLMPVLSRHANIGPHKLSRSNMHSCPGNKTVWSSTPSASSCFHNCLSEYSNIDTESIPATRGIFIGYSGGNSTRKLRSGSIDILMAIGVIFTFQMSLTCQWTSCDAFGTLMIAVVFCLVEPVICMVPSPKIALMASASSESAWLTNIFESAQTLDGFSLCNSTIKLLPCVCQMLNGCSVSLCATVPKVAL